MFQRRSIIGIALVLTASPAFAGDMDGLWYAYVLGLSYLAGIILSSMVALIACRLIGNRRVRTVARWLIVIAFYTPVVEGTPDHQVITAPAFWWLVAGEQWPHWGWPTHPFFLAYAGALVLSAPVVALWIYLRERDRSALVRSAP